MHIKNYCTFDHENNFDRKTLAPWYILKGNIIRSKLKTIKINLHEFCC